jgi:uncharacterized protein DUF3572
MISQPKMSQNDAVAMAIEVTGALAASQGALEGFLLDSGLTPDTVRQAAASPGFLASVLDYVASDEALLIDIAARIGIHPARIAEAQAILSSS